MSIVSRYQILFLLRTLLSSTLFPYTTLFRAAGMVARSDVDSAVSELENARVQQQNAQRQQEQLGHALAVVLGDAPSVRAFVAQPREFDYPQMPVTIPSALLERLPDIVAAERRVAAANAELGV